MPNSNNIIEKRKKWESPAWLQQRFGLGYINACHLKSFIAEKLSQQHQKDIKEFKEKLAGLKEIKVTKWREKDFEYLPNKRGIWYGGFGEAKKLFSQAIDKILKEL